MKRFSMVLAGIVLCCGSVVRAQGQNRGANDASTKAAFWFRNIVSAGPNSNLAVNVTDGIHNTYQAGREVKLLVPAEMTRTRTAYYALTWSDHFYVFPLSEAQARGLGIEADGVGLGEGSVRRGVRRAPLPSARLGDLRIDDSDKLTDSKPLRGAVKCKATLPPQGKVVLRFTYMVKGVTVQNFQPLAEVPADGVVKFEIKPVNEKGDRAHEGPLPAFVDLCVLDDGGNEVQVTVVSNTLGILLDLGPATAVVPEPGNPFDLKPLADLQPIEKPVDLTGPVWQFNGTATTVEFLPGGKVRFNNTTAGGGWKQDGDHVTFDCNNFTRFDLRIDGDKMTGTWSRLRGEDVGKTAPSGMHRIR